MTDGYLEEVKVKFEALEVKLLAIAADGTGHLTSSLTGLRGLRGPIVD